MTTKCISYFLSFFLWIVLLPVGSQAGMRALWITRYDYKNATDVVHIMENSRLLGANTVFFQVRGNATVFYPSKIEPWAWELTGNSSQTIGVDPGWNPMAVALKEAKKQGLQFHAWMNVFPGWRGVDPAPRGTNHPWVSHRSWFMVDQRGILLQPEKSFYAFLSPGISQVRSYLASVFGEVAKLYPEIDGVHLDYVRYPGFNEVGRGRDFSYDKESVTAFTRLHQQKPNYILPEWQRFKCEQVSATILAIRQALQKVSPKIELSATCFANIHTATSEKGQDPRDWLREKWVDWVVPMAYERNVNDLNSRLADWDQSFDPAYRKNMVIGINVDFNNEKEIQKQLDAVYLKKYGGVAIFAYAALFPNHASNAKERLVQAFWQEQQIQDVLKKSSSSSSKKR